MGTCTRPPPGGAPAPTHAPTHTPPSSIPDPCMTDPRGRAGAPALCFNGLRGRGARTWHVCGNTRMTRTGAHGPAVSVARPRRVPRPRPRADP
eukprot:2008419-Prymnesium_polylepis.2